MRKFLIYISYLLVILVAINFALDGIYTYAYNNGAYRNKVMWLRDMKDTPSLDYLIVGSSRANYSLKPDLIYTETGKLGYNLGMNACSIVELQLLIKEFLERGTTKAIFVQVDDQYKQDYPDPIGEVAWIPFIYEDDIYGHFSSYQGPYTAYKLVPFYRYQKFRARLGFREVVSSLSGQGYEYINTKGYMPRYGVLEEEKQFIPDVPIIAKNTLYDELISFCKANKIDVYFFTAPFYKYKGDIQKLHKFLPNYINFSDSIKQRLHFSDQIHLNTAGANKFTEIFIETYFSEPQ